MGDSKHSIVLEERITDEDYRNLRELESLCNLESKTTQKLELEFKINLNKDHNFIREINEFLYKINDSVVGYLGINSFGGGNAEINGMVHPEYRRNRIFQKLMKLAASELLGRGHKKALLLSDRNSPEGIEFIKSTGAKYSFSEYKMFLNERIDKPKHIGINLRKGCNSEFTEMTYMDSIFFGKETEADDSSDTEVHELENETTYFAEKDSSLIGKIRLDSYGNTVGIYGFGVLPKFRGKGYGREMLNLALDKAEAMRSECIYLEVASENKNALNLYKSCGFVEKSVMDYYELRL